MKFTAALLPLGLASAALAAPVPVDAREASPAYGSYGAYPPPAGSSSRDSLRLPFHT